MELHLRPLKPKELQYVYPHTDPLMCAAGYRRPPGNAGQ